MSVVDTKWEIIGKTSEPAMRNIWGITSKNEKFPGKLLELATIQFPRVDPSLFSVCFSDHHYKINFPYLPHMVFTYSNFTTLCNSYNTDPLIILIVAMTNFFISSLILHNQVHKHMVSIINKSLYIVNIPLSVSSRSIISAGSLFQNTTAVTYQLRSDPRI